VLLSQEIHGELLPLASYQNNLFANMPMTYEEVLTYLYENLPMFQKIGGKAYKKDLTNTIALCEYLKHPEKSFKSVHIAGTNGKGSSSHYLAAILQKSGYKTGLYTSPHLKSFTERIRINGREVSSEFVTDFVNTHKLFIEELEPSFFEITVGMAFAYFALEKVDIAIVEVGMGGRLDSTNVITPEVSLITNISLDHQQWLGNTLPEIAAEKAGIIKPGVPIVISELQPEIQDVFQKFSRSADAPLHPAYKNYTVTTHDSHWKIYRDGRHFLKINSTNLPVYQQYNLPGVLQVVELLREKGYDIPEEAVFEGIHEMKQLTGLKGRWDVLSYDPLVICDVGHNLAGIQFILRQLERETYQSLHVVWGMVSDKDVRPVLKSLPREAIYYFCTAKIPRAMNPTDLHHIAEEEGLKGVIIDDVNEAINAARKKAEKEDLILIGGSNFVVAEINEL
jgi:dihydrofolate synthase / folylpolyglutamate synthase